MSNEALKALFTETFGNLSFFYRDTPLNKDLAAKYTPGQILREEAFTDCTHKQSGLQHNFRYLIASSKGWDMSGFGGPAGDLGLIVIMAGSYYKVLDVYELNGKTQVLLLQIPAEAVDFFKRVTTDMEEVVIQQARKNFDELVNAPVLPELAIDDWQQRVSFPIGMSENGEFFYKD
jgi:hypothetical protein